MKTENTIENKKRFFALYWGQNIYYSYWGDELKRYYVDEQSLLMCNERDYLLLKPLSAITDEDALYVAKTIGYDFDYKIVVNQSKPFSIATFSHSNYGLCYLHKDLSFNGGSGFEADYHKLPKAIGYLRSKGYTTSCFDLSRRDLIEYGWVKLEKQ